jgi:DNA-binding transcriptional LysR family regulator
MKLSSLQLEAFYAIAKAGNFTVAASELHVTQSALSQRILNLERELDTTLVIRDRAGLRLTEIGQNLLRFCQTQSALEADFLSQIKSKETLGGVIRIGGFSSVMRSVILPSLSFLINENPLLKLEFHIRETHELLSLLKHGEVDFIVTAENLNRDEIECVKLGTEQNVLVEKENYKGPDIYLDHNETDETTLKYLRKFGSAKKLSRRYLDDVYGLLDGVKLGLGKAILPVHLILSE